MRRAIQCVCWLALMAFVVPLSFAAETQLPTPATEALQKFEETVNEAKTLLFKAIEEQIDAAAKTGNLNEVKALKSDKENLETYGILPKSTRLKASVTKARGMIKVAYEKTKVTLEAAVKEHTKAKDFDTAELIQKSLDKHVRTWGEVASGVRSALGTTTATKTSAVAGGADGKGNTQAATVGVASNGGAAKPAVAVATAVSGAEAPKPGAGVAPGNPNSPFFTVNSATWGYNEIHKQGLPRKDFTAQFAKMVASGNEVTVNEAVFGSLPNEVSPFKALNVDMQVGTQTLRLWIGNGTKLRIVSAQPSSAELWEGGPIQFVSAQWMLEDGSRATDALGRLKELLKTKNRAIVGFHEFGEIQFGKGKVMPIQIQAKTTALQMRLAESTRIEVLSSK